jgi:hypothetical protein
MAAIDHELSIVVGASLGVFVSIYLGGRAYTFLLLV